MSGDLPTVESSLLFQCDPPQPEVNIPQGSDAGTEAQRGRQSQTTLRNILTKLSVYWLQPTLMVTYLVLGVLTAVTHHLYYYSLHHRKIYHGNRQQWPLRIGAGLSFLTISLFNMAISAAYTQYVWIRLKKREFSLLGIDHLFSLTSDPSGLFSKEILTRAKSVALIALLCWLLPIGTVISPATLAVANVVTPLLTRTNVPTIHTNIQRLASDNDHYRKRYWTPTPWVRQITAWVAISSTISDIPSPATNASYEMVYTGPALKCSYMNQQQERLLKFYRIFTGQKREFSLSGNMSAQELLVCNRVVSFRTIPNAPSTLYKTSS